MRFNIDVVTRRGVVLNGTLFQTEAPQGSDTVMIAITGIHGNFCSNPFYYNIGDTLNTGGFDFIYAQTNDAFSQIKTLNVNTGRYEIIGSWNERFCYTDEDIEAYLNFAEHEGYKHIILAGHSLGANKVIYYLSRRHAHNLSSARLTHFFLLSPANLSYMTSGVTEREKRIILEQAVTLNKGGRGAEMLPFPFMGWVTCIANTAYDWLFSGILNNVHTSRAGDFSQAQAITHTGAMLVGTYDNFTDGDPVEFLENLNNHMPTAEYNKLIFIEKTGHTYQNKHQEVAEAILRQLQEWASE